ncbi:spore protease YyaC [Paenibacillus sp. PR3]|uniref:Spore protease YyaC n=1 Tax=Paenibacillus terricola TaxID=2763503 RepID=A0ABR8N322_9BACL|nr:spore protease YyaC [Paenibacillus terricola]MBD3922565.1 spore protease YyaC [Paenibacillus terricola]
MGIRSKNRQPQPAAKRVSITVDASGIKTLLRTAAAAHRLGREVAFVCIGTDCSTGDAFGPLVGTALRSRGWNNVNGTMEQPLDAKRIAHEGIHQPAEAIVIAIDACLGKPESIGMFAVAEGPLKPGEGIGLNLAPVGDYSIAGVVNRQGPRPYQTLQATSLHLVMQMAESAAAAIDIALRGHP